MDHHASSSRAPRQTILGFMGRRKRAATSEASTAATPALLSPSESSPLSPASNVTSPTRDLSPNASSHLASISSRSNPATPSAPTRLDEPPRAFDSYLASVGLTPPSSQHHQNRDKDRDPSGSAARFPQRLIKRRSIGTDPSPTAGPSVQAAPSSSASTASTSKYHRIRIVPCLNATGRPPSLQFEPIVRVVKIGKHGVTIGRYLDSANSGLRMDFFEFQTAAMMGELRPPNDKKSDKVTFKSKVVSRMHALLWVDETGQFWLKDTKSSSGTFLNHSRLSPPGQESQPQAINDGDIIQLGIDYQGGREEVYRCVRMKIEVGRGRDWQGGANVFNTTALQLIRSLKAVNASQQDKENVPATEGTEEEVKSKRSKKAHAGAGDCCICLFPLTICQALFIAPCSHAFHFRCVRPLVERHYPGFSCPLCRTFADLEADVEDTESLIGLEDLLHNRDEDRSPLDADADSEARGRAGVGAGIGGASGRPVREPAGRPPGLYEPESESEILDRAERREMLERMEREEFESVLEASRIEAAMRGDESSLSHTPDELARTLAGSALTSPLGSESLLPRGAALVRSVTDPTYGRSSLAIDTRVDSLSSTSDDASDQHSNDLLKTAVNPRTRNPFHADGETDGETTPIVSATTLPSPAYSPPGRTGLMGGSTSEVSLHVPGTAASGRAGAPPRIGITEEGDDLYTVDAGESDGGRVSATGAEEVLTDVEDDAGGYGTYVDGSKPTVNVVE